MKKIGVFQVVALLNFIGLMSLFLLHQAGYFSNTENSFYEGSSEEFQNDPTFQSPNSGSPFKVYADTTIKTTSQKSQNYMSSSKTVILKPDYIKFFPPVHENPLKKAAKYKNIFFKFDLKKDTLKRNTFIKKDSL